MSKILNIKINNGENNHKNMNDNKVRKRKYKSINVENVIRGRLSYQTTQRELENKFNIKDSSFANLTTFQFLNKFNSWDELKKGDFIRLIGGGFFYQTRDYLNNLIQMYQKSSNSTSIKVYEHTVV